MSSFVRVTKFSHEKIAEEINARRRKGECPRPTFESVIQEMVTDRQAKLAREKKNKK